ncbi:hypothetical protein [Flavobacterium sp. 3HN19-14]|uniref:hypothetical protein n=1 Tax=Flavobacterium sp. 3HN19-14 TaxID=3448133 RepID=UPI003EDF60B9
MIINKIKSDSIISKDDLLETIHINVNDGENINDGIDKKTKCVILFVLDIDHGAYLLDLNRYPNISKKLNFFSNENIISIDLLEGEKALSLYGSHADCGVVILKTKDKILKKIFKNK